MNCSRCKNDICAKCKKKHDGLETDCENAKFKEDDGLAKWLKSQDATKVHKCPNCSA